MIGQELISYASEQLQKHDLQAGYQRRDSLMQRNVPLENPVESISQNVLWTIKMNKDFNSNYLDLQASGYEVLLTTKGEL